MLVLNLGFVAALVAPLAGASCGEGAVGGIGCETELLGKIHELERENVGQKDRILELEKKDVEQKERIREQKGQILEMRKEIAGNKNHFLELDKKFGLLATQVNASTILTQGDPGVHDLGTKLFRGLDSIAHRLLKPFLLHRGMVFVSSLLILQWHIRFHFAETVFSRLPAVCAYVPSFGRCLNARCGCRRMTKPEVRPMMFWRKLGLNILIPNIY